MNLDFQDQVAKSISAQGSNQKILSAAQTFLEESIETKYSYNFAWMGRPIIQYPQDIVAFQELVFSVKPDLIIETGVAHGGSLTLSASLLALLDIEDNRNGAKTPARKVVGIDIDIRPHNRALIEKHFLYPYIQLIEGSSVENSVVREVTQIASGYSKVMVCLDSNHTEEHVLEELNAYSPLVSRDSYCIVFDTVVENLHSHSFSERPWSVGNNPMTAVRKFLETSNDFIIDRQIDSKLLISVAPMGYLRRV